MQTIIEEISAENLKRLILAILIFFLISFPAYADNKDSLQLLNAKSLKCSFPDGVFTKWDTNAFHTKTDKKMTDIVFDSINLKEGKARVLSKFGAEDVTAFGSVGALIFFEPKGTGTINITSIFVDFSKVGETGLKNTFLAVHSRHVAPLISGPLLSQYYGKCEMWDLEQQ